MKEKEKKKIIRRLDKIGRIVIPKEIRKRFEILEDDPIEIFVDKDTIILKKYEKNCTFCGSRKKLIEYNDKLCSKIHLHPNLFPSNYKDDME